MDVCSARDAPRLLLHAVGLLHAAAVLLLTAGLLHAVAGILVMCLWPHIRRAVLIKGRLYMLGISTFVGVCSARDAPGLLLYAVGLLHAAAVLLLAAAVLLPATANAKLCLCVTRES